MDSKRNDISYILEEYSEDKRTVAEYKAVMAKYKIDTPQGREVLERKIEEFEAKHTVNRGYMAKFVHQMSQLENCIRTFDRIDTEHGNRNEQAMAEFERMVKREQEKKAKEEKKKEEERDGR